MADYYTNVSFAFEASKEQIACLAAVSDIGWENLSEIDLSPEISAFLTKEQLKEIFGDDEVVLGDIVIETYHEPGHAWVHGSNPFIENLARLIQAVIQPEKPIGFQWSNDCTKERLDAFGGGCCAIFKDRIEIENTSTRLDALMQSHS